MCVNVKPILIVSNKKEDTVADNKPIGSLHFLNYFAHRVSIIIAYGHMTIAKMTTRPQNIRVKLTWTGY